MVKPEIENVQILVEEFSTACPCIPPVQSTCIVRVSQIAGIGRRSQRLDVLGDGLNQVGGNHSSRKALPGKWVDQCLGRVREKAGRCFGKVSRSPGRRRNKECRAVLCQAVTGKLGKACPEERPASAIVHTW